jgi:muconate cycloisomerase
VKVTGFEILVVRIPLRVPVVHALARRDEAVNLMVAAHDDEGRTGWGETCPRPYVTGETIDSAREELRRVILPAFLGRGFDDPDSTARSLLRFLDGLDRNQHAAFCAAELALLDLAGQAFGISAGELLGPVRRERIEYSGVIAAIDPDEAVTRARELADYGVRNVKVKVGPDLDENLRRLTAVRETLGADAELRIDANCAWDLDAAVRQLEGLSDFRLAGVEQPLPATDLQGLRALTAAAIVPVVADECLATLEDARRLVDRRACDIFNVRIAKVGGLLNAGRIHRCARAAGLECQLGAQVGETGLLSAAGRHYGTRADEVRWCEGSYDRLLLETQVTGPDITFGRGGWAPALTASGLGVAPDPARLDNCTLRRFRVG